MWIVVQNDKPKTPKIRVFFVLLQQILRLPKGSDDQMFCAVGANIQKKTPDTQDVCKIPDDTTTPPHISDPVQY